METNDTKRDRLYALVANEADARACTDIRDDACRVVPGIKLGLQRIQDSLGPSFGLRSDVLRLRAGAVLVMTTSGVLPLDACFRRLLHFVLPAPCLACAEPVWTPRDSLGLCPRCRRRLVRWPHGCGLCGRPIAGAPPAAFTCRGGLSTRKPSWCTTEMTSTMPCSRR